MGVKKIIVILIMIVAIITVLSINVYAEETTEEVTWTDTSNVTFETKMNGARYVELQIKNIEKQDSSIYRYVITDKNEKPEVNETNFSELGTINYNNDEKMMYMDCTEYMELNQDMYLWVCESIYKNNKNEIKFIIEGEKIDRVEYPKGIETFENNTFMTSTKTQIVFNRVPWGSNTTRKINLKIGKISDQTILNEIKNGTNDCIDKLIQYAKNSNGIFEKTLISNSDNGYDGDGLEIGPIEDKTYYFLYVELDDENGKYYPVEGVTLALSSAYNELEDKPWFLFFYGGNDFEWIIHETTPSSGGGKTDPTVATTTRLPNTGIEILAIGTIILATGLVLIFKNRYKKYKGI